MEPDQAVLDFTCPRCCAPVQARFYGPCPGCRAQLVAAHAGQGRAVEVGRFEPALQVVPNQVATKE